jgi:hypothetical protein
MRRVWKELRQSVKDNPPDIIKISAKWARCHRLGAVLNPPTDPIEMVLGLFFYVATVLSVPSNAYGSSVEFPRSAIFEATCPSASES